VGREHPNGVIDLLDRRIERVCHLFRGGLPITEIFQDATIQRILARISLDALGFGDRAKPRGVLDHVTSEEDGTARTIAAAIP
jgi:hypothetical protein